MAEVIATIKLAPGVVGLFDPLTRIHLMISNPTAYIYAGMNIENISYWVKTKKVFLVSGSLTGPALKAERPADEDAKKAEEALLAAEEAKKKAEAEAAAKAEAEAIAKAEAEAAAKAKAEEEAALRAAEEAAAKAEAEAGAEDADKDLGKPETPAENPDAEGKAATDKTETGTASKNNKKKR